MENQNKSMSKAGLLGLSLVDHRQYVSRLKHFQWIFLTIKTKPKCITKFFKVLHDLTPSYLLKQQKSPLLTSNSTLSHMNFFQSLNTPCHFLPPGLCSRCSWNTLEHTFTVLPYDLASSCWPFRSELSITPSRKPPLTPKHLAGHTLLDPQPITVLHTTGL